MWTNAKKLISINVVITIIALVCCCTIKQTNKYVWNISGKIWEQRRSSLYDFCATPLVSNEVNILLGQVTNLEKRMNEASGIVRHSLRIPLQLAIWLHCSSAMTIQLWTAFSRSKRSYRHAPARLEEASDKTQDHKRTQNFERDLKGWNCGLLLKNETERRLKQGAGWTRRVCMHRYIPRGEQAREWSTCMLFI